jgi:hypothetical protein
MPNEDATLRDGLVKGEPGKAEVVVEKKAEPDAAAIAAAAVNADALEVGKLLIDSGYTKDKVNELLTAPGALQSLRYLIQNNPAEFLNVLEKTDPTTGEKFLETMADTYVKRYAPRTEAPKGADGKKADVPAELLNAVEDLRGQIKDIRTKEEQKQAASAMAQVQARYIARVDDLFGQLPKDLGLNKAETKALRAQLQQELSEDPNAVQRISNGNFVDVPNKFKSIIEAWTGDRKAVADAEKSGRERTSGNANAEFLGGPQPFIPDMPNGFADSWDNTEDAFAKALVKASR